MFCSICIADCNVNNDEISLLSENFACKLLTQVSCSDLQLSNNSLNYRNIAVRLECQHIFHIKCLLDYFSFQNCYCIKCPMCRQYINLKFTNHMRRTYHNILETKRKTLNKRRLLYKFKKNVYRLFLSKNIDKYFKNHVKMISMRNKELHYEGELETIYYFMSNLKKISHKPCKMVSYFY